MTAAAIARAVRADNERIRREACATCGDRCAPFKCAWACEVPRFCSSHLIEVGDVVIRLARHWRVTAKEFTEYGFRIDAIERNPAGRAGPKTLRSFSTRWYVLRPGVCGARACERHVREVGEGRYYCRAHWRAWDEADVYSSSPISTHTPSRTSMSAKSRSAS